MLERVGRGGDLGVEVEQAKELLGRKADIRIDEHEVGSAGGEEARGQIVARARDQRLIRPQVEIDADRARDAGGLELEHRIDIGHRQLPAVAGRCDHDMRRIGQELCVLRQDEMGEDSKTEVPGKTLLVGAIACVDRVGRVSKPSRLLPAGGVTRRPALGGFTLPLIRQAFRH